MVIMCTAINITGARHLFGRTLDVEHSLGERVVITPRGFRFDFRREGVCASHLAMVGMALVQDGVPLYFDAVNEAGLCAAALKFPSAVYHAPEAGARNIASFELIPWLLCRCEDLASALDVLDGAIITRDAFSTALPPSPLHFIIADKTGAAVIESVADGLKIYADPLGVLTNDPPFPYHMTRVCDFMNLDSAHPENTLAPSVGLTPYSGGLGAFGLPGDFSSSSRFVRAVFAKNHTEGADEISRFFHVADSVSVPRGCEKNSVGEALYTVYTSLADTASATYYFTTYENRRLRSLSLFDAELDTRELSVFDVRDVQDVERLL